MEMTRYFIKPRTRQCVEENEFLLFVRNLSNKYGKKIIRYYQKTGLDGLKASSKN